MTSADGKQVCLKGWQVAGIKGTFTQGLSSLASLDPFDDIDPMFEEESNVQTANPSGSCAASKCVCEYGSEDENDEEEWVKENGEEKNRNIFDLLMTKRICE